MASSSNPTGNDGRISEEIAIKAFHVFTVKSLSQAKLEGLIEEDTLASAEADVMITGPALCFYFAALRSNTDPPSVPYPTSATGTAEPVVLSSETCPPIFQSFFRLWAQTVPPIQALTSDAQHDLARIICDKPPLVARDDSSSAQLMRIAADLRAVAIEITQRRTFQERYQHDLQSALDVGRPPTSPGSEKRRVAAFAPPPSYDEMLNQDSQSPHSSVNSSPRHAPATPSRLNAPLPGTPHAAGNAEGMQSLDGAVAQAPPQSSGLLTVNQASSSNAGASSSRHRSRPSSPTFLPPDAPAIHLIRETLYAALGEVIATTPTIVPVLKSDPSRAYFSAVSLAILTVATDCLTPDGGVLTPLGHELTLAECPPAYKPLMIELGGIGAQAKHMREEDDERAMYLARSGRTENFEPRMDRLRKMLEKGVAAEEERYDAALNAAAAAAAAASNNPAASSPPVPAPAHALVSSPSPIPTAPAPAPTPGHAPTPGPAATAPGPVPMPNPHVVSQPRGRNTSPPPPMPIPTVPGSIAQAILSTTSPKSFSPPRASGSGPPFTTPAEDALLLHPTTTNASQASTTSSPRSSSESTRGQGIRNLLHKSKPGASEAPTPPPKPAPPAARHNPPSTPPPGMMPVPHPPVNPAGMAGVGTTMVGPAGVGSPPRAAMMAHQTSLSAAGNPYDIALGSGARIAVGDSAISQAPAPAPAPAPAANGAALNASAQPVPAEPTNPRRSIEGTTVQFANRINGLALNMTRLRMFQERQDMVFKILASVHD
ncbi:hypothetical protein M408DRAFT_22540 [Serendipita vermifera MAFF 305830]|uniref:Uncharacterized protein n=1 Tax=Serendipita vermifera MAFF 305830 TaxID=933852 RepID=A0A0C3BE00_SERVB|nr:hypothetical protein M408DRAFT_22540 [Serendipita vermifera MAFF 305830]